jgi:hypothetical protein
MTTNISKELEKKLKKAIEEYKKIHRGKDGGINPDPWCAACMEAKTFCEAAAIAASARLCGLSSPGGRGLKHPHQRRIPNKLLEEFAQALQKKHQALSRAADFEELMSIVSAAALPGIGALTIYDTALRLGFRLKLRPGLVYLHRGTLKGARLLGIGANGSIAKDKLPKVLKDSDLDPGELEDFLCVFPKTLGSDGSEICGGKGKRGAVLSCFNGG